MSNQPLRVIPLGGLGEIGKNMMALEYGDDIVAIDAGVMFPEEDMPGIDFAIPDITYLTENRERLRALLITHGHEDHIGALPWVLSDLDVPVYCSRLTEGLIKVKLREHGLLKRAKLNVIQPHSPFRVGAFQVEFFRVCHSIPDAMGIAVTTPVGTVVHTGDFKIDHTPVDGMPTDFAALGAIAAGGVLLMCADSTYADQEGYTPSERVVGDTLDRVVGEAPGRVMVASFASLISRIQQVINAAVKHDRKVAIIGRGMVNNTRMALSMGYLTAPDHVILPLAEARQVPHDKLVVMATGSQGEPTSALVRIANHEHPDIEIVPGDTIVVSATPIPGNETLVARSIDNLFRQGARVLYGRRATVHVHGHASREELKMVLGLVRPRFFVPVHGEYRHLVAHAELAESMGLARDNIFVLEDGDVLELTPGDGKVTGKVPAGHVFVDGTRLWGEESGVLVERRRLAQDGVVIVTVSLDEETGLPVGMPQVTALGFSERQESEDLFQRAAQLVLSALERDPRRNLQWVHVEKEVTEAAAGFLRAETHRRPNVVAVVQRV